VFPWSTTEPRRAFSGETLKRLDWPATPSGRVPAPRRAIPRPRRRALRADRGATAFPMSTTGHAERPSSSSAPASDPQASTSRLRADRGATAFPWSTTGPRRAAELQLHVERSPGLDVEHSAADMGATAFPWSTTGHAERPSSSSTPSDPEASTSSTPGRQGSDRVSFRPSSDRNHVPLVNHGTTSRGRASTPRRVIPRPRRRALRVGRERPRSPGRPRGHAARPSTSSTSSDPEASTLSTPPRTWERLRFPCRPRDTPRGRVPAPRRAIPRPPRRPLRVDRGATTFPWSTTGPRRAAELQLHAE
jgi:hypothetical protein